MASPTAATRTTTSTRRSGRSSVPLGKTLHPVDHAIAGDIVAIAKLSRAETGDTLSTKDDPLLVAAWEMPEPLLPVAIQAKSKADEDKLSTGLQRIVAEEPTVRLDRNTETAQLVLWCMGEAHADVLIDHLARQSTASPSSRSSCGCRCARRFAGPASGHGRHVKQSGGHGQFAVCDVEFEPLPEGSGFEFVDKIYGGSVPNQFIPSVEKGIRAQMERGVAAGYPGRRRPGHAARRQGALRRLLRHGVPDGRRPRAEGRRRASRRSSLLEPVLEVVGARRRRLRRRRDERPVDAARSRHRHRTGRHRTHRWCKAEVPEVEVTRYAIDLRSLSHGTATFSRHHLRYEPMPSHVASKVLSSAGS